MLFFCQCDVVMDHLKDLTSPLGGLKKKIDLIFSTKERRKLAIPLLLSLLCFAIGLFTQYIYFKDSLRTVDVSAFQNVLYGKEDFSKMWMERIRKKIAEGQLPAIYNDKSLYDESEKNEVSFHVYKGDSLIFWTSDVVGVQNDIDFDLGKSTFVRCDNMSMVAMQSFFREYRILAFIKIKENFYQMQNSKWNTFANSFNLPGNVVVSEVQQEGFSPIFSWSGNYLFSLQCTPLFEGDGLLFAICVFFWIAGVACLFFFADALLRWRGLNTRKRRLIAWLWVCLFFPFMLYFFSVFHVPPVLFQRYSDSLSYSSFLASSAEHLFVYAVFFSGILTLLRRNLSLPKNIVAGDSPLRAFSWVLFLKFIVFVAFSALYLYILSLVYDSNVNLAVPSIQEVNRMSVCSVLLMMLWAFLLYECADKFRVMYVARSNIRYILVAHLILTVVAFLLFGYYVSWMDGGLFLLSSLVILYVEIGDVYLKMNMFVRTVITSFMLVNLIVVLTYWHSERKCTTEYGRMAKDVALNNCVREDPIAEIVLKDYDSYIKNDSILRQRVNLDTPLRDSLCLSHLTDTYLRVFKESYNIRVQIEDKKKKGFNLWRTGFGSVSYENFDEVKKSFRILEDNSHFYVCADEAFSVTFFGIFQMGDNVLYIKLYPKLTREIHGLSVPRRNKKEIGVEYSMAKYCGSALCYSDGIFRYPANSNWLPRPYVSDDEEPSYTMNGNGYTHYVYYLEEGEVFAITSVPDRQSYVYVIFVTFLFSVYLFISVCYFFYNNLRERKKNGKRSFVATMQTIFIFPMVISFFILSAVTFPFFSEQYEKTHHTDMRDKSYVAQHNLQDVIGFSTKLSEHQKDIDEYIRNVSDFYQMDVLLYDSEGKLFSCSRPIVTPRDKMRKILMNPRLKFCQIQDLYVLEKFGKMDCYSNYVPVYNNRNERVGYLKLLSIWSYYHVKTQLFNIMVVIVDIYLFVMVLSIIIIWMLNRRTVKPLSMLTERFAEVRLTGENTMIHYDSKDELGDLVRQYNKMVGKLEESAKRLVESERDFAWRDMARRIAHEVKNPLTPMKLCVQQCQRKKKMGSEDFDAYFEKSCNILIEQIDTLAEIATSFSSFAKASQSNLERVDILRQLEQAVDLFANNEDGVVFSLEKNGYEHSYVMIDEKHSLQMFSNLFSNAIQSIPEETFGHVDVSFSEKDGFAVISIADNGCGVSEEARQKMFIPNFTTKTSGMGLGMAIVKSILDAANGDISFKSELDVGTTFYLKIPLCKDV